MTPAMKIDSVYFSILRELHKLGIIVKIDRKYINTRINGVIPFTTFIFKNEEDILFYKLICKHKETRLFKFTCETDVSEKQSKVVGKSTETTNNCR